MADEDRKLNPKTVAIGAGIAAAAAAAAAGYYFYASKDAKKHRKIAAKWAGDMKREIVRQGKKVKNIDRAQLMAIIDRAAAAYETARAVDPKELAHATEELRDNWQQLIGELHSRGGTKTSRASRKRATKKTARASGAKKRSR